MVVGNLYCTDDECSSILQEIKKEFNINYNSCKDLNELVGVRVCDSTSNCTVYIICKKVMKEYMIDTILQHKESKALIDCGIRMILNYIFEQKDDHVCIDLEKLEMQSCNYDRRVFDSICKSIGFCKKYPLQTNSILVINEQTFYKNLC